MPTLRTVTLGCKVNQYETEFVRQGFLRLGYRDAVGDEPADLCVVNTCTVTSDGDMKSRKLIRQFARKNPEAEIIVMGCYATRAEDEVAKLPGVVEVVADKRDLPELLTRRGLVDVPTGISSFGPRHRAYVKVQDGCRLNCSYCIIPKVRPNLISRPIPEVQDEVARLIDNGHKEIVLTGIHLGHYGADLNGRDSADERRVNLTRLTEELVALEGQFRLRLSSLEAVEVSRDLIQLMADNPTRICPHLHISMQSGSDAVLTAMRRRWPRAKFIDRCLQAREALDRPAMTTDVIVGFPGETEADFEATCQAVLEIGFSKLHVFRFSPRQGTVAAELPDQIPAQEKQRRAAELIAIGSHLRDAYTESLIGTRLQVLVESAPTDQPGTVRGTSCRYIPVEMLGSVQDVGRLIDVRATRSTDKGLIADPLDRQP